MANPQPDKFTKISNELLEAIYRYPFGGNELRVMLFLIRKTYGYQTKVIKMRIRDIEKELNIPKQNINRVVKSLLSSNCITKKQKDYKHGASYSIQKDYDAWKERKRNYKKRTKTEKTVIKMMTKRNQNDDKLKITPFIVKEKRKDNNKCPPKTNTLPKLSQLKNLYPWLDINLWSEFRNMRTKIRKPMTAYAEKLRIGDLKKLIDKGYSQSEIVNKSISSSWQDFYEPKKDEKGDEYI